MSDRNCFGIGRRKNAVAKVTLLPGKGLLVINNKPGESYLQYNSQYINTVKAPLQTLGLQDNYDL